MTCSYLRVFFSLGEHMAPSEDADCMKSLHWICGNVSGIDPKSKFNPSEFYKVAANEGPIRSCVDESASRLSFEIKGPYSYHLYSPPLEQEPKCLAVDLFFKEPVKVGAIRFQNYYVAYLSVLAKIVGCRDWQTLVQHKQLMPSPQHETGSRAYFEVKPANEPWTKITEIRLVLLQPSACWKKFTVEHVSVYREDRPVALNDQPRGNYLTDLIQKTRDALAMERRNEGQNPATGSNIPFHIGTTGYEIEKLPPLG